MRFKCLLALFAALLLSAQSLAAERTLVIGVRQFPTTLHPLIEPSSAKTYVLSAVLRPLTAYGRRWQRMCVVCTTLPTMENGMARVSVAPDGEEGMAVTYAIDPQLTWGDGTPVTSDDVAFTRAVGRHPRSGAAQRSRFQRIRAMEVHGPKSFTFHLDTRAFDYNDARNFWLLPAHLERETFRDDPEGYRERTAFGTDPTHPGLYFGPYLISEYRVGAHVVLTRNPHWRGARPEFDRVVIRTIEDTSALIANLLSGDVHMIAGEIGISVEEALRLEESHAGRFNVIYKPGLLYEHMDVNLGHDSLRDVRVRRALLHATNRRAIVETLFQGKSLVADSNVSPLDPMHSGDVPVYDHDPAKSARLLSEAGWHMGSDGMRRNAAGEPLSVEVHSTAGHRTRETVLAAIRDQWRRVGVDLRVRLQPPRLFFGETLFKRRFPGLALYAYNAPPEWVPRDVLHSSQIPTAANGWAGHNLTGYSSGAMDSLVEEIERTLPTGRRKVLWSKLQRLYAEELPVLPLFFYSLPHVLPPWLHGVVPTGHETLSTLWIEHWRDARQAGR